MSNDDKTIDLNLSLQELRLSHLSVKDGDADKQLNRTNKIELKDYDENNKLIKLFYTDKIISSNFDIHLELDAVLALENEISKKILEEIIDSDSVDDLAFPILAEASHIISFITSKTDTIPLIIPPTLRSINPESDKEE